MYTIIIFKGANCRLPCEIETVKDAATSMVAANQGIFRNLIVGQESVLQVPKDLARLESLLVMIDRWSLGYSCAVLLVGILQVFIMIILMAVTIIGLR